MKPVSIQIPRQVRLKIDYIVDKCDKEVSGLGTVVFDRDMNAYIVQEIYLLDQEVGAAHTDIDDNAITKAMYELRESEGELCFWWHSHVNMQTFWSGTDHATIDIIARNGLCVAAVFNKKGDVRGAIAITPPDSPAYKMDDVLVETLDYYDFDTTALDAEIKERVREKTWAYPTTHGHGYNKGWDYGEDDYIVSDYINSKALPLNKSKVDSKKKSLISYPEDDQIRTMAHEEWQREPMHMKRKYEGGFAEYLEEWEEWYFQTTDEGIVENDHAK